MYTANLSSAFLGFALAFNAWYIIVYQGSTSTLLKLQFPFLVLCFLVPTLLALIPVFVRDDQFYGSADLWCWIRTPLDRLYFFYIFLWIVVILNLITYLVTYFELRKFKSSNARKNAVQEMMFRLILAYSLAMIISWIPGTANRINDTTEFFAKFPLVLFQAVIAPGRGFLNAVAFWYTMRRQKRVKPTHAPLSVVPPLQSTLNSVTISVSPIQMEHLKSTTGPSGQSLSSWLHEFSRESSLPSKGFDHLLASFEREHLSAPQSAFTSPGMTTAVQSPSPLPSAMSVDPTTLLEDSVNAPSEFASSESLLGHSEKEENQDKL
jgi:hypothetical protein